MSFKIRCVKTCSNHFIKNKEYIVTNGKLIDETGDEMPVGNTIDNINKLLVSKFELVEEKEQTLKEKYILNASENKSVIVKINTGFPNYDIKYGVLYKNTIQYNDGIFEEINNINSNLNAFLGHHKIIEIFHKEFNWGCDAIFNNRFFDEKTMSSVWKKDEIPEHTMEELVEKLGYEFKIKK